jgi:hypothetical protein
MGNGMTEKFGPLGIPMLPQMGGGNKTNSYSFQKNGKNINLNDISKNDFFF